jgi:hypothetical protein
MTQLNIFMARKVLMSSIRLDYKVVQKKKKNTGICTVE